LGGEAALPVQLVQRRLPDRVVAVLQLDDPAPVLRRQRAPVVEHHRDEVAAGVVEDAVVRAHQAAKALDRAEPGLVELAAAIVGCAVSGVCPLAGAGHLRYKATACLASRE